MSTPAPRRPAIYGLGIIGSRILACLQKSGFPAPGWNRSPKPEISGWQAELATVAAHADTHQVFVSDDSAVRGVIDALLPHLSPGHIVLVHATISPDGMREVAQTVETTGADFVEAPFTGSRDAAAAGKLTYYLGGKDEVIDRVRPVLEPSARCLVPLGPVGHASVAKIATNMVTALTVEALAEALAVTRAAGVDEEVFARALEENGSRSGTSDMKTPSMLRQDFTPHFSLAHMLKDARLALALADTAESPPDLPALRTTAERMAALAGQLPDATKEDFSILARHGE